MRFRKVNRFRPAAVTATFLLGLIVSMPLPGAAQPTPKLVEATGIGSNHERALQDAQRRAVEEAVGLVIGGESLVRNYTMVSDLVASTSFGYVRDYDILDERPVGRDETAVTIRAAVEPVLDRLLADQQARDLLLAWLRKPGISVAVQEDNAGDAMSRAANAAVAEELRARGFNVVAPRDGGGLADLVVEGEARAHEGEAPEMVKKAGMVSMQADVRLALVQADTRSLLAARQAHAAQVHIDPASGGAQAIAQAARLAVDSLLADVVRTWALQRVNTVPVLVTFTDVAFDTKDPLLDRLRGVRGVRAVYEKAFDQGALSCYVDMEGTSDELARGVDGIGGGEGGPWTVRQVSWGRIDLERGHP